MYLPAVLQLFGRTQIILGWTSNK